MTDWREVPLGDVLQLQRGFDLTQKEATPGPFPVISSGGVSYSTDEPKVSGPGVVTGRKGVLGKVHFSEGPYWPHDTTLWVKDFRGADPRFVYYLLQTLPLVGLDVGAANPTLNRNHAHLLSVRVPDLAGQRAIAAVLGAIDDLIANNRRRVEVLEAMARAIYREWFVHFRFPGHEDATIVDCDLGPIPKAWSWRPFTDVASFMNGFAFKPAHLGEEGRPVIKIKQLKGGVSGNTPRSDPAAVKEKFWIEPGDLLMSWSAHLGVYWWMDEPGLLNQHLFKVSATTEYPELYLFYDLDRAMPQFWDRAQGTTMRHIKRAALTEVHALAADLGVVEQFVETVEPLVASAIALRNASAELQGMRDLLLPKLVTGQIDVSDLDLEAVVEKAGD